MSVAPWYLRKEDEVAAPSLKFQKTAMYNADPDKLKERFDRGAKAVSLSVLPRPVSSLTRR